MVFSRKYIRFKSSLLIVTIEFMDTKERFLKKKDYITIVNGIECGRCKTFNNPLSYRICGAYFFVESVLKYTCTLTKWKKKKSFKNLYKKLKSKQISLSQTNLYELTRNKARLLCDISFSYVHRNNVMSTTFSLQILSDTLLLVGKKVISMVSSN